MAQADAVRRRRQADQPAPGRDPATAVDTDFLALLRAQLGSSYKVVVVQEEFDAELPVDADKNDATGTGPLAALRRRLRRAADDARRDPRPQGLAR